MKTKIFLFHVLILSCFCINAQDCPMNVIDSTICYEGVILSGDNSSNTELFDKAMIWIAENFIVSPMVSPVQLANREQGIIVMHIVFSEDFANYENVYCKLKLQFRNGKCKYRFNQFMLTFVFSDNTNNIRYSREIYKMYIANLDNIAKQQKYGKEHDMFTLMKETDEQVREMISDLEFHQKNPVLEDF
jgi:hypothetical protein